MNRKKNNVTIVSSFLFHTLYWMMCCVPNTYTLIRDFQRRDNQSIWSFSWGKNQKMSGESKAWQLVRVDVQNPPRQNLTNLNRATNFTPQVVFLCKMRSKLKDFPTYHEKLDSWQSFSIRSRSSAADASSGWTYRKCTQKVRYE